MFLKHSKIVMMQLLLIVVLVACEIGPDKGGDQGGGGGIVGPEGVGMGGFTLVSGDPGEDTTTDLKSKGGVIKDTFVLKLTSYDPTKTYEWGSSDILSIHVKASTTDLGQATVQLLKETPAKGVKVSVTESGTEVASVYFGALVAPVAKTRTIDGTRVELEFMENFNDMDHVLENWVVDGTKDDAGVITSTDVEFIKRPYWSRKALVISNNTLAMRVMKDPDGRKLYPRVESQYHKPGNETSFIAGGIHWKDTQTQWLKESKYGYFETRIRMDKKTVSHWDAFWTYEHFADEGNKNMPDQTHHEFDVMEYTDMGSSFEQTTHWWESSWSVPGKNGRWMPSRTQHVDPGAGEGLKDWFYLGFLWTPEKLVYLRGDSPDNMVVTKQVFADGTVISVDGSKAGSMSDAQKAEFKKEGLSIIENSPQNWKFTTELGRNFAGSDEGKVLDGWLNAELGNDKQSIMFVDYFAAYRLN